MESDARNHLHSADRRLREQRAATGSSGSPVALLAHILLLAGATGAVFLAAGVPQGSAGIFLSCAGAALVFCPPSLKVDGRLWFTAGALTLCAALAFLPTHWFPVPPWRKALESLPVVPLPPTITPVPWQSAFWLALLAFTALTGLFMLAQPVRSKTLLSLTLAASLVCGMYAALAIYAKVTGWHYPFTDDASFGFFPNRNHTATFLITGSILAMGVLGVVLRDGRWIAACAAAAGLTVCVTALFFYSASRGGIVFLLAGTLLWIIGLGRTHRNGRLQISVAALSLASGALFLVSGSAAQNRIADLFNPSARKAALRAVLSPAGTNTADKPISAAGDTPFDLRVLIYEDTLPLIRDFPITGTGLGTFETVFPQYRNASLSEMRSVHPESDWLMLAAEAGVPALLSFLALIWLLARRLPPLKEHPYWPLRWGCVTAAAAALLHGLVDVPVHHLSLGWWILVVAGLGFQPGRHPAGKRSRWQHAIFVLGGVAMLWMGVSLIRAEWFGASPLPPFATERARSDIVRAYEHHDVERAARIARQAIFASPLDETLYYQWGALELPFADSDTEVDAAFKAERLLDPGGPTIPLRQGEAWLHYDSARTATLWLEALSRRQHMDRLAGLGPDSSVGFYQDLLMRSAKWPAVQRGLMAATDDHPRFALAWLESARPELVRDQLDRFSKEQRFLDHLNADERRRFLLAWYAKGDRATLMQFTSDRTDWQTAAWPVRVRQWVDAKEFERAAREAATHYQISLALPVPDPDGRSNEAPEQEAVDPVAAFDAYWRSGNTVAARRVLAEAARDGAHPAPAEIWRLKAADAAGSSDWNTAWQCLQQYIRVVHGDESL